VKLAVFRGNSAGKLHHQIINYLFLALIKISHQPFEIEANTVSYQSAACLVGKNY